MGQTVEIFRQRLRQFLLADGALIEDQFFHRRQAVAEVGDTHLQAGNPVIFRAALLDAFRPFDTVIHQRRTENIVDVFLQHGIDHILNLNGFTGVVADLVIPVCQHLVEISEVAFRQGMLLGQEYLTAGGIAAAFQRRQHHPREVDKAHAGAAVAPFAANRGFDAADSGIIVGVLRLDAEFDKFRDDDFVVIKRRHAEAAADHLDAGVEEVVAHPGMVTHAEVRLGRAQTTTGFQDGIRQRVDGVLRLAVDQVLAANGDVLVQRAAGRGLGVRAGANFVDLQQLQPAAVQQLNGLFAIQRLLQFNVATVVRIEVLVHTAKGDRVAIRFNLQD